MMPLPSPIDALRSASASAGAASLSGLVASIAGENPGTVLFIAGVVFLVLFIGILAGTYFFRRSKDRSSKERITGSRALKSEKYSKKVEQLKADLESYLNQHKSPSSIPWFLLMGGSSSGKTYALQNHDLSWADQTNVDQGAGGTEFMDWWFHKDGIILDTAGALVGSGEGEENPETEAEFKARMASLREFLSLLKENRAHRPINGLILAVSVVDLQVKTDDERIRDAKKLRSVFNLIQEELDVRFPVIVWVTKCDKLVGFREYFRTIPRNNPKDPQRRQRLGWSRPGNEREALGYFSSADMQKLQSGLRDVVARLRARCQVQLSDLYSDGGSESPEGNAAKLYCFPSELESILNPLEVFLSTIFLPEARGANSSAQEKELKPPFLRGVYFTSATMEGAELDRALDSNLRAQHSQELQIKKEISQNRLPKEKLYTDKQPRFITDSVEAKLIKEQGLVTRNNNAVAGLRALQWKMALVLAAMFMVLGLGVWGLERQVQKAIRGESRLWQELAYRIESNTNSLLLWDGTNYVGENIPYTDRDPKKEVKLPEASQLTSVELYLKLNSRITNQSVSSLDRWLFGIEGVTAGRHELLSRVVEVQAVKPLFHSIHAHLGGGLSAEAVGDATWEGPGARLLETIVDWQESAKSSSLGGVFSRTNPLGELILFLTASTNDWTNLENLGAEFLPEILRTNDQISFGDQLLSNRTATMILAAVSNKVFVQNSNRLTQPVETIGKVVESLMKLNASETNLIELVWYRTFPFATNPAQAKKDMEELKERSFQYLRDLGSLPVKPGSRPYASLTNSIEESNRAWQQAIQTWLERWTKPTKQPIQPLAKEIAMEIRGWDHLRDQTKSNLLSSSNKTELQKWDGILFTSWNEKPAYQVHHDVYQRIFRGFSTNHLKDDNGWDPKELGTAPSQGEAEWLKKVEPSTKIVWYYQADLFLRRARERLKSKLSELGDLGFPLKVNGNRACTLEDLRRLGESLQAVIGDLKVKNAAGVSQNEGIASLLSNLQTMTNIVHFLRDARMTVANVPGDKIPQSNLKPVKREDDYRYIAWNQPSDSDVEPSIPMAKHQSIGEKVKLIDSVQLHLIKSTKDLKSSERLALKTDPKPWATFRLICEGTTWEGEDGAWLIPVGDRKDRVVLEVTSDIPWPFPPKELEIEVANLWKALQ